MNTKRFLLASLAVYVAYHVLGFLIHEIWLAPTYEELAEVFRPRAEMESMMWIFFVTGAIWTLIFVYVFVRGYENQGIMEGVRYGAMMGLFVFIVQAYDSYVVYPIPYTLALNWFISGIVSGIIFGVIAALIYKPE